MASARKKQDEKHLKILRELVALPANKECFDCHQRGPTYVNMTIGSFVCTSCSGMLRGLTPPHRVKSISMASFSPEEIDLVKSRGNEYCRRVWLGLFDANHAQDTKDEQQVKEFMVAKYEKKRYYLEPSAVLKNGSVSFSPPATHNHSRTSTPTPMTSIPETKSVSSVLNSHAKPVTLNLKVPITSSDNMFTPDKSPGFLADFGSSDPFRSSQAVPSTIPSFANFDNNPIFNSPNSYFLGNTLGSENVPARFNTNRWSMPTAATLTAMGNTIFGNTARKAVSTMGMGGQQQQLPPSEDRYAALKDLDCLMKTQQASEALTSDWATGTWPPTTNATAPVSVFGSPSQASGFLSSGSAVAAFSETAAAQNPFSGVSQNPWVPASVVNGPPSAPTQLATFTANPFRNGRQIQPGITQTADGMIGWGIGMNGIPNGQVPNGGISNFHSQVTTTAAAVAFPASQSMNFSTKTWPSGPPGGNPFMLGTGSTSESHSNNPFL